MMCEGLTITASRPRAMPSRTSSSAKELGAIVVGPRGAAPLRQLLADRPLPEPVRVPGRGVDQAPGTRFERRPDHVARAFDVDPGLAGIVARPHRDVGGDVEDRIHALRHGAAQAFPIENVALDPLHRKLRQQPDVRARPMQRRDLPLLRRQLLDQVEPEESGAAGDERGPPRHRFGLTWWDQAPPGSAACRNCRPRAGS